MRWLAALLLVLAPSAAPTGAAPTGPGAGAAEDVGAPPVLVRVLEGHASVVTGGEPRLVLPADGAVSVSGSAFLSLAPGSSAELRRRGTSSLRLAGTTEMEWGGEAKDAGTWTLFAGSRVDAEVRRGRIGLKLLGEGWELGAQGAAFHVRRLASGELEVLHHGGELLTARPLDGGRPRTLRAGERTRLPAR
jgi:hypothetical protein